MTIQELLYDLQRETDPTKAEELIRNFVAPPIEVICKKVPKDHALTVGKTYQFIPLIGHDCVRQYKHSVKRGIFTHEIVDDDDFAGGINPIAHPDWMNEYFDRVDGDKF